MISAIRTSIVIPALNEERRIGEALRSVLKEQPYEVIVVDGGSTDGTVEIVRTYSNVHLVLSEKRGRAFQMNQGALRCSGDVFLFLHADSVLPDGWLSLLNDTMKKRDFTGGCYFVKLSNNGFIYRLTGWMINVRTLLFRSFSGDQAIFLRREVFDNMGGVPDVPLMEDLMVADYLRRTGKIHIIRKRVITSARNWERWGPGRMIFLMWYLKILFRLGRSPEELSHYYRDGRFPPLFRSTSTRP